MTNLVKKKRQGQYFTGVKLAKVLVSLATQSSGSLRVIDPMAGIGDMLVAFGNRAHASSSLTGIEIDEVACKVGQSNLESIMQESQILHGNAFDPDIWSNIGTEWDLVITNPPYVRYQSLSKSDGLNPSGEEVRQGLIRILNSVNFESEIATEDFVRIARTYSGLSDLAVPCWILCMSICSMNGKIALILPSTWLSREYSSPVLYLLRRYFRLETLVEDQDVSWFPGTQVRTTALIATRVPDKGSAAHPNSHKIIYLPKTIANIESLVGNAFPTSDDPELSFAEFVRSCNSDSEYRGIRLQFSNESDLIQKVIKQKNSVYSGSDSAVPEKLQAGLGSLKVSLISLQELGWNVGQGMRTGANDFFYVSSAESAGQYRSRINADRTFCLPQKVLLPALVRQHELPIGYIPSHETVSSYLLYLQNWDFPSDLRLLEDKQLIEGDLQTLIEMAEAYSYEKSGVKVKIPDLSAVKTNVRRTGSGEVTRKWFQLPTLADRHIPELFLPRIVGAEIKTYLNCEPALVIDANFNTLWKSQENEVVSKLAILALMNSDWTRTWLESVCTSMGGGALKIEAVNLKALCFPRTILEHLSILETLGSELLQSSIEPREFQVRVAEAMKIEAYAASLNDLRKQLSLGRNT
jgi:hypothetical protein